MSEPRLKIHTPEATPWKHCSELVFSSTQFRIYTTEINIWYIIPQITPLKYCCVIVRHNFGCVYVCTCDTITYNEINSIYNILYLIRVLKYCCILKHDIKQLHGSSIWGVYIQKIQRYVHLYTLYHINCIQRSKDIHYQPCHVQ